MIPFFDESKTRTMTSYKEESYIDRRISFDSDGEPLIKNSLQTRSYVPTSRVKVHFSSDYMGGVDLYEFVSAMRKMNRKIRESPHHVSL